MTKKRTLHRGISRVLSWLLAFSMTASLLPAMSIFPARASGLWSFDYDADAFSGENLSLEVYDADSGQADLIEWFDSDGIRIADKTAEEIFGDGHSYYAIVQYQNTDAVMAEYRNFLITTNDLEAEWEALPDSSEDSECESKATYDNDYDAFVDAQVDQMVVGVTPADIQASLDEMVRNGFYTPTGDYSVMVNARTVALEDSEPALYIDADFFADCVPVEWILPDENFTVEDDYSDIVGGDYSDLIGGDYSDLMGGDYSDLMGGDYSDLMGGDYSDLTGGDYSDLISGNAASGSLKLYLRDNGYDVPVLVQQLPAGAYTSEDDTEADDAGSIYLSEKLGVGTMANSSVDGTVDPDYSLCVVPGEYTMIYEDSSSGTSTLDWEDFTVSDDGGSVDFSGTRDFISIVGSVTGYLPDAEVSLNLWFDAQDGPSQLGLALSETAVQCRPCTFENVVATVSESVVELAITEAGDVDSTSSWFTVLTSNFLLDAGFLNTSDTIRTVDLGDLAATQWQSELTFTSNETGESKEVYTAGEAMTGKLSLHNGEGLSLTYQFYMAGSQQEIAVFTVSPTDELFERLYTLPSFSVEYSDGETLFDGVGSLNGFTFYAPDSSRQVNAAYTFVSEDGVMDITASASEVINVGSGTDTKAPLVPTGFAGENAGSTVDFTWSANTEEDLSHYRIYRTDSTGEPIGEPLADVSAGNQSASVTIDSAWGQGPWYFAVSACDKVGNESELCTPIIVQDPNADFFGETQVSVTTGKLEDGVLTLAQGGAGALNISFTADPSLPVAGLPGTLAGTVAYEDTQGEARNADITLNGSGGVYSAVWNVPADAAQLVQVSFLKNGAEIAVEPLSYNVHTTITVQFPDYDALEYFPSLRVSGKQPFMLQAKNGAFSGTVSRVNLSSTVISLVFDSTLYSCSGTLGDFATGDTDVYVVPLDSAPDLMVVLPSWDPSEAEIGTTVSLLDADGRTLSRINSAPDGQNAPILVRNRVDAARIMLTMIAGSTAFEIVCDDAVCAGIDWQKGGVVSAFGTLRIKDATSVMNLNIYRGANGDEPYEKNDAALIFENGSELYVASWWSTLKQADVSAIPAGTYTVTAGHNCVPVQVTLTGEAEVDCPDLIQYDQVVFRFELSPTLAEDQPNSIKEEQSEEWFTSDAVHLLTDQLRVFYWDTSGIRQELPLSDSVSIYGDSTTFVTQPVLLRDVDLDRGLEVDTGGFVQLLFKKGMANTQSYTYSNYRVAPLRDSILFSSEFSSASSLEDLRTPLTITYTGSPILTLQASPTIQVNATRTVDATRAYFYFVDEDGVESLEIADFAASSNGRERIFRFDEMLPGTYDVLFYLSDNGRMVSLEQKFLHTEGEFVPPADTCAVGTRDVTFDDENNVLYLNTPDAPVDESEPGMHNLSITPDKGVVMDGDLLSFTVKFTYVPEDQPYAMELRPLGFSDGAYSVSVKRDDGSTVSCQVNDDGELTLPNDQGVLTGTVIYAGTARKTPSTVGPGFEIYEITNERGDQWYNVIYWVSFYSSLGTKIKSNDVPINGRSDAEPFEITIVSNADESAVYSVAVTPSRYGYWNAELTFPFTVETGMEESFTVTYQKEDGTVLLTQNVSGSAGLSVLPTEIRYSYYMVSHTQDRFDYTVIGHREDDYKALRDASVTFGESFGSTTLTLEVEFDDTKVNENGYTDAQLVTTPSVVIHSGRSLYVFDMVPADKVYYTADGEQVPYATTYTVTYQDTYYGPFEICYDVLNPVGTSVPEVTNPSLPTSGSEYEALVQDWTRLTQDIYDAGGALVNNGPDTTFTYTVEDVVFEEITCADLAPDDLPETAKEKMEEENLIFLSDEPRDLTVSVSNYTSVTAIEDVDAAIAALDAVEDEENPWLYYTREEGEDGVVAYIRYYNPRYAFVLSEEQPETLPGEEERVSLDLVVVQEYAMLYDFSALTQGAAQTAATDEDYTITSTEEVAALAGFFDDLFDDGFGPPENWGPKPMTVMDVGDGSLSMEGYAKAVLPGTANAILETGEMVNKGIGVVEQAAEVVEILGLDPEELKAPEGTDQLLLGKKGAAALKMVDYAKKGYDAYNKLSEDENDPKKAKLKQVENDLKQVRDQAMQRCSCLLDEKGAEIQMQIQAQYQEGLVKIQEMITAIDVHEAINDLVDIGQDVAPAKVNVYKAAADVSIDLTQEMANDIHDSQRWLEVNNTYRIYYNGISRLSFGCDPTKCDNQEPRVEDNLSRPSSPYTGTIPSSPIGVIRPTHAIDPSGVVYEGLLSNPLEDVTCTIQYKDEATGQWLDWVEAPGCNDQTTVIVTGDSGYYRWDVPAGTWRVEYYKAGYNGDKPLYSGEMPVPPVWLDVNQPMLANDSTPTASARAANGGITVTFDVPVQWETLLAGTTVTAGGKALNGTWTILTGGEGDIYPNGITFGSDGLPQQTPIVGQLVTSACFVPDSGGSGDLAVTMTSAVKSYGGAALAPVTLQVEQGIGKLLHSYPNCYAVNFGVEEELVVLVTDTVGAPLSGTRVTVSQENETLDMNASVVSDADGRAVFRVKGICEGSDTLTFTAGDVSVEMSTRVNPEGSAVTAKPTANLSDFVTVPAGTTLELSCTAAGAVISYTTDDTCPCTGVAQTYTGPISLTESGFYRIAAWTAESGYSERLNLRITVVETAGITGSISDGICSVSVSGAPEGSLALCAAYSSGGKMLGSGLRKGSEAAWDFTLPAGSTCIKLFLLDGETLAPLSPVKALVP